MKQLANEEAILARKPTQREAIGGHARQVGFNNIPKKEGYEIVYKPYGNTGNKEDAGYYYKSIGMKHLPKEIIVNWKKEPQFGGNVIYMSPDEYIDRVHIKNKLSAKEILDLENRAKKAGLKGILYYPPESKTSQDYLKKAMLYGKALDIPWIEYDVQDKLRSQEGYNRALAAKSLDIKQIPVEIIKPFKDGKCVKHIDIQKYVIQDVKHYRARVQGEDWKYETNLGETLDMFRNRIMDTLDCGIVTHFLEDWDPLGEKRHLV